MEEKGLLAYYVPKHRYEPEWFEPEWYLVEERTALVYMSMLAQALADLYPESIVPGTDRREYETLIYGSPTQDKSFPCIETHLHAVLPVSRQDVPLEDILAFKRKREAELSQYRAKIDELQQQLKQSKEPADVKLALTQFDEEQRQSLANLIAALKDAKVATIWGSVKTLTSASAPTMLAALAVALGLAPTIATLPIAPVIAGTAIKGAIDIMSYSVDERNKRRALERASPFAYFYHAKREGIVD